MIAPSEVLASLTRADRRIVEQARRLLLRAAATGQTVKQAATSLRRYLSPWASLRRGPAGEALRAERAVGSWPGRPGSASSHDRRLAQHLANVAHGDAVTERARRDERAVRWLLSVSHVEADECDDKATRDSGLGRGVYLPRDVPGHPSHYGCLCVLEAVDFRRVA